MKIKYIFFTLLFTALMILGCNNSDDSIEEKQESCIPSNLQNGIIAFYPFSNGSINDFSGNNHHLTNTSSANPGTDRDNNSNCAFHFDALNSDFLVYTNPTFIDDFQTLPFSISLWYKNDTSTASNYELLIGRDSGSNSCHYGQWSIGLYDNRTPLFGNNCHYLWWGFTPTFHIPEWRHLTVTSVNNDLKIYVNGTLTSEVTGSCGSGCNSLNVGDLFIGKDFTGSIDDIIIYNRVLIQSEITELYNLTPCCQ